MIPQKNNNPVTNSKEIEICKFPNKEFIIVYFTVLGSDPKKTIVLSKLSVVVLWFE